MEPLPFRVLLYRYVFFAWLFKDVARCKNVFERSAVRRHNKEQSRWLPLYMRRYAVLGVVLYGFGMACELLVSPLLSAFFYVPGTMTVPMMAVAGVAWTGLRAVE